jgi:hypothetical protein
MVSPNEIGKAVQASFGRVAEVGYLIDIAAKYLLFAGIVQVASAAIKVAEGVNSLMDGDRAR